MNKPVNQKAWFLILPVFLCVAFSAILPLMTVVNYSVQDIISPERRVFVGTEWFAKVMRDGDLHAAHLGQLDVAEHRKLARAVDARCLVVRVGDGAQPGKRQQRHQRCPVPHIHQQHREPGLRGIAGVAVLDAHLLQHAAHQPDVGAAINLPDGAHHVPGDQQRQRHHHQHRRRPPALRGHGQREHDAQRNLHRQHRQREGQLAPQRRVQLLVAHHGGKPFGADEHAPLGRDDVLHRVVHHGHQRQDGREGHAQNHGQDQEPGFLVDGLGRCAHPRSSSFW